VASPGDKKSFSRMQVSQSANTEIIPKLPPLPDDVKKRFPSLYDWQRGMEEWRVKANIAIRGGAT
jgi:hypothetical protein